MFNTLEDTGIIYASRGGAQATYIVKHALISDAIYSTIPTRYRNQLHEAAANAMLGSGDASKSAEIARHFRSANAYDPAARYFESSGDRSQRVAAHAEAISEYVEALHMVAQLPLSHYRMQRELTLNRKVAAQHIAKHGIPTAEAAPFYESAGELSRELDDVEEVVNAAWGLWSIHLMVADMDHCLSIAENLNTELPENASDEAKLIVAYMLGITHAYRGTLAEAAQKFETVQALHREDMTADLQGRFGMDIALTSDSFLAWVYVLLGQISQADETSYRALERSRRNDTKLNHVFAHVFAATKALFQGQIDDAEAYARAAQAGAKEMGYPQWEAQARFQLARVGDLRGEASALDDMRSAMEDYRKSKMILGTPYALVWIADGLIRRSDYEGAMEALDELAEFTARTKECYFNPQADAARAKALAGLVKAGDI